MWAWKSVITNWVLFRSNGEWETFSFYCSYAFSFKSQATQSIAEPNLFPNPLRFFYLLYFQLHFRHACLKSNWILHRNTESDSLLRSNSIFSVAVGSVLLFEGCGRLCSVRRWSHTMVIEGSQWTWGSRDDVITRWSRQKRSWFLFQKKRKYYDHLPSSGPHASQNQKNNKTFYAEDVQMWRNDWIVNTIHLLTAPEGPLLQNYTLVYVRR